MNKFLTYFLFLSLGALLCPLNIWARMESDNYVIYADVFSSGGLSTSTSDTYSLHDTIGEAIILSATSTSANYGAKVGFQEMYPGEFLSFAIPDPAVDLGTLSDSATKSDSHTMIINTNATNGFAVTVSGSTLTSGVNTIAAIGATASPSTIGAEQFGINLVANNAPSIGADPSGSAPIGAAASPYDTADQFAFNSGDVVASASSLVNQTTFTISYIANVSTATAQGNYSTTLTFAATANF
ncbi:MAG: hypothetical protein RB292_03425 [Patescibacteria group bacterium]|jgi:hypothetical protein|nr:hypothetical protein [Patescibacteria group bacterium]